jgi:hypothetical protein
MGSRDGPIQANENVCRLSIEAVAKARSDVFSN